MIIQNAYIDHGRTFDWGKISSEYAKYRDIYPQAFYDKIIDRGLCVNGQDVLDLGTGTGVIPRNLYKYGANWTGVDISEEQIDQAKMLSVGMNIRYIAAPVESMDFQENAFDAITACQCFWYFDHETTARVLHRIIKPNGRVLILYMAWLPYEDIIAEASEKLALKYNPDWSGAGEKMHPRALPECYRTHFDISDHEEYLLNVHFTRDSWHGRMKTCRGIGATLSDNELQRWEADHKQMLLELAPDEFEVLHYGALLELKSKR